MKLIRIDFTHKQAEFVKLVNNYKDDIELLINTGVFDLEEGKVIIHKRNKQIQDVEFHLKPFKRKRVIKP